jgi:hypothetical protein
MTLITVGCTAPRQQYPGADLGQLATPHPLSNKVAFVFSHRAANLKQQLIMGILTHWPIQKHHLAAMLFKLLQQYHLMHIVPRKPIWRSHDKPVNTALPSHLYRALFPSDDRHILWFR